MAHQLMESQKHTMVWAGRNLKDHLVQPLCPQWLPLPIPAAVAPVAILHLPGKGELWVQRWPSAYLSQAFSTGCAGRPLPYRNFSRTLGRSRSFLPAVAIGKSEPTLPLSCLGAGSWVRGEGALLGLC